MRVLALLLSSAAIMASPLACDSPDVETSEVEEVGEAPSAAILACSNNMFTSAGTDLPAAADPAGTISLTYGFTRGAWLGLNYMSGDGLSMKDPGKTQGLNQGSDVRARRFPGGLGGFWDWQGTDPSGLSHKDALKTFIQEAASQSVPRLFFVVNINGVYRVNQAGNIDAGVVTGGTTYCINNANYSEASCRDEMATSAGNFAATVKAHIQTYYTDAGKSSPEVIFEIGNEIPLLIARSQGLVPYVTGTFPKYTVPTAANYASIVAAYAAKIQSPQYGRTTYKIAAAGLGPEHGDNSIWKALFDANVAYDYRVVHDYGWVPAMNNANGYGRDHQETISNAALTKLRNYDGTSDTNPNAAGARPVAITEFGSADTFTNGIGGVPANLPDDEVAGAPTYTQAILNESIQAATYANLENSIVTSTLKWPTKARVADQEFRSWEPQNCTLANCSDAAADYLPNYMLYKLMGPFLNAATKETAGNWAGASGVFFAQAAHSAPVNGDPVGKRYAVFTNVSATDYRIRVAMPGIPSVRLEGIRGYVGTKWPTHIGSGPTLAEGACSKAVNNSGVLVFGLAARSMAVVTY